MKTGLRTFHRMIGVAT